MKLVLSGEGPTDIGETRPIPGGTEFVPGPMAEIVDALLMPAIGYSVLDNWRHGDRECVVHFRESQLAELRRESATLLPGLTRGRGTALHTRAAECLGRLAQQQEADGERAIAVLFRDSDGTRSTPATNWSDKLSSMQQGFERSGFERGVPMLPKPKSEAWLLCALKPDPYQRCEALEDEPGNDDSPRALKSQLAARVGHEAGADEQAEWVRDGRVDPAQIQMPSFEAFKQALQRAAESAVAR